MKKMKLAAFITAGALLTSCTSSMNAANLSAGLMVKPAVHTEVETDAVGDFSLKLFNACYTGDNTLISPMSVLFALGMTSEGAKGDTLSQFEELFGLERGKLAESINSLRATLEANESDRNKVKVANSIWFRDYNFEPVQEFLDRNAELYGADIFKAPFDSSTLSDINNWVSDKTDGMIKKILDEIPEEAVMYLVNALSFDCEWSKKYEKAQVRQGEFTCADGKVKKVDMMHSEESAFLKGSDFTGFIKYYAGGKYAFAALLPNEGKTPGQLLAGLDGKSLNKLLSEPMTDGTVRAAMPKFETEYSVELSEVLESLGLTDAFDSSKADFTGLGISPNGNIYVSRVLHKTFIEVAEAGTRAGAATVVEMSDECAIELGKEYSVTLDRPFVYIIFETTDKTPLFIGTLENPK